MHALLQVSFDTGPTTSYAVFNCQDRGNLFLSPRVEVYKGQTIGIHQRLGDLSLNACKKKVATNVRSNKEAIGSSLSHLLYIGSITKQIT
jgi:GTP-binding protein